MKKIFAVVAVLMLVIGFSGCEEKSEMEKAKDSMSKAYEDTKDAVKDATK